MDAHDRRSGCCDARMLRGRLRSDVLGRGGRCSSTRFTRVKIVGQVWQSFRLHSTNCSGVPEAVSTSSQGFRGRAQSFYAGPTA